MESRPYLRMCLPVASLSTIDSIDYISDMHEHFGCVIIDPDESKVKVVSRLCKDLSLKFIIDCGTISDVSEVKKFASFDPNYLAINDNSKLEFSRDVEDSLGENTKLMRHILSIDDDNIETIEYTTKHTKKAGTAHYMVDCELIDKVDFTDMDEVVCINVKSYRDESMKANVLRDRGKRLVKSGATLISVDADFFDLNFKHKVQSLHEISEAFRGVDEGFMEHLRSAISHKHHQDHHQKQK